MRETGPAGAVTGKVVIGLCCFLGLAQAAHSQTLIAAGNLPEAVIVYGFLRSNYPDLDQMLSSCSTFALTHDMKELQNALESLGCDVVVRLAFPHKDLVVPLFPLSEWIGFPRTGESPPRDGTLFVTEPMPASSHRVWAVLSSVAPERTTVFWLQRDRAGYRIGLVYDTFNRGEVKHAPGIAMGAITEVSMGEKNTILLKEWRELGSRPQHSGLVGNVYKVDLELCDVTLKIPGALP